MTLRAVTFLLNRREQLLERLKGRHQAAGQARQDMLFALGEAVEARAAIADIDEALGQLGEPIPPEQPEAAAPGDTSKAAIAAGDGNDFPSYSAEERRVCDYLQQISAAMGCGEDPIGFLIAAHAFVVARANGEEPPR